MKTQIVGGLKRDAEQRMEEEKEKKKARKKNKGKLSHHLILIVFLQITFDGLVFVHACIGKKRREWWSKRMEQWQLNSEGGGSSSSRNPPEAKEVPLPPWRKQPDAEAS
jgi:hypothetical protein